MKTLAILLLIATSAISNASAADTVSELTKKGDAAAKVYNEQEALKNYLAALRLDPKNVYLHVAISREYRHLMSDAKSDAEKFRLVNIALTYAHRAAALGPKDTDAQLAPAITYGKLLPLIDDNQTQLEISKKLKAAADNAIAIDPRNDLAWHILGRWHRGIAEVSGVKRMIGSLVYGKMPSSTYQNAAACFRHACTLRPDRPMHHIELGCTLSKMGNTKEARHHIAHGLTLAETEKDDSETKKLGRDTLKDLR